MEYLDDMDGIYENIKECNPDRQRKLLITFGNMIADIKPNLIATSLVLEVENYTYYFFLLHNLILL